MFVIVFSSDIPLLVSSQETTESNVKHPLKLGFNRQYSSLRGLIDTIKSADHDISDCGPGAGVRGEKSLPSHI